MSRVRIMKALVGTDMEQIAGKAMERGLKSAADTLKSWNSPHTPTADFVNSACDTMNALANHGVPGAVRPGVRTAVHGADTFGFFDDLKKSMANTTKQAANSYAQSFKPENVAMSANLLSGAASWGASLFPSAQSTPTFRFSGKM